MDRWARKINTKEQKDCTIESGEENKKVEQRMETTTKQRKKQGAKVTFHLSFY